VDGAHEVRCLRWRVLPAELGAAVDAAVEGGR
jgi:hypothetical protein